MKILTLKQQGPDWLAARAGRVTASRAGDVMAKRQDKKESADRANYRIEVATEILTGKANENYVSKDMVRGTELEPVARGAYEMQFDCDVDLIGLVQHPTIELFAGSPDGLVGTDGGVELKAPRDTNYVKWVVTGEIPVEHVWQCYAGMACCEREWWDLCAFSPSMPKHMRTFRLRLVRDEKKIAELEAGVRKFLDEVQETIVQMERIFGKIQAPKDAQSKSTFESTLEASLGINDADIEYIMRQQAERMFD